MEMDVEGITYEPKGNILHKGMVVDASQNEVLAELSKVMSMCNLSSIHK